MAAEACLDWMDDEEFGPLAGEAFSAITGLIMEGRYRKLPPDVEQLIPLEEESLDANLVPGPEKSLPLPRAGAVEAWWHQARKNFERGVRYLRGTPVAGVVELLTAFQHEPLRRQSGHAMEVAIRSRGAHLLQPRAFSRRQLAAWEMARTGRGSVSMSPFTKLFGG
ncbi:hypothetical protein NVS55_36290 [Myxococcus stipitatus]|uniref:hypothetical protein n=1 Tax=Myxococcus stipitatus TaxID=83455 RepID=UPI003144E9CC